MLVVFSGPSGVGKDTVIRRLREIDPTIAYSVSYTTRPPRAGEVDGIHYRFVTVEEFAQLRAQHELLEWAEVHGHFYGTPWSRLAEAEHEPVILKIDVQGAAKLRRQGTPARYIFLLPPSTAELIRRLTGRSTESADELARRERDAVLELAEAVHYDHSVVNDDVDRAARELLTLIRD
ncbi:MAG: guanylate kinase [Candidatus Dormibacteria bacterium]